MIPKKLHYCFGLTPNFGYKPWSLVHYVCVRSAIASIKPTEACLYYEYEPSGPWWDLTKPLLDRVKIEAPREIFGNPVKHPAHRADVVRLQKLIERGGIYLDCDVFVHRSFDDLLQNSFVLCQDGPNALFGLSNAVMLSEPDAPFPRRWYEEYRWFRGGRDDRFWIEHSIQLPAQLAKQFPEELTILPHSAFCWPLHYEDHLKWIFAPGQPPISHGAYANHLWETNSWTQYLEHLTPRHVRETRTNFHDWARPYLAGLDDDLGAPSMLQRVAVGFRDEVRKAFHTVRGLSNGLKRLGKRFG
jgi:hypothetical protein